MTEPRRARHGAFEVLEGGLQTTVQDLGRRGYEDLGVPRSGAADPTALVVANLLVGNDPAAAALECTLLGPRLLVLRQVTIALAGSDLGAVAQPGGRGLAPLRTHALSAGTTIEFTVGGGPDIGCRAYLALAGGIDVDPVMGSRSTSLVGGFGGLDGRALRTGDEIDVIDLSDAAHARIGAHPGSASWPTDLRLPSPDDPVRVLSGPAASSSDGAARLKDFLGNEWSVTGESDRRGLRLDAAGASGPSLAAADDRPSQGVVPGAIQLTPSGQPLVLGPDAGTTGGYPVIAVVVSADLGILGQLAPGSTVGFQLVEPEVARAALIARQQLLLDGARAIQQAAALMTDPGDRWDDLWRDARG